MGKAHCFHISLSIAFIVTLLVACSSSPEGFLTPTAVSNTIDAEGNVYFGTRYATSGSTYSNTLNIDYLHDDSQVYRVQVQNETTGTSELGRIEKSTATARKGTSSIRFQTTTTNSSNYSKRAELVYLTNDNAAENFPLIPHNTEKYTGFSIRFPGTFVHPKAWLAFHQIWQDIAPPIAFEIANSATAAATDPLKLRIKVRNDDRNSLQTNEWHWPVNRTWADGTSSEIILQRDRWYDFVMRWKTDPSSSASGILQVWLDGVLIVNYNGKIGYTVYNQTVTPPTGTPGVVSNGNYEKLGIYRDFQNINHSLFQDEIRTGTQFFEVIPARTYTQTFANLNNWVTSGANANWIISGGRLLQQNGGLVQQLIWFTPTIMEQGHQPGAITAFTANFKGGTMTMTRWV